MKSSNLGWSIVATGTLVSCVAFAVMLSLPAFPAPF